MDTSKHKQHSTRAIAWVIPRNGSSYASLLLMTLILSGCGLLQSVGLLSEPEDTTPLSAKPYTLMLTLTASDDANPDTRSRPSPIQVRVFLAEPLSDLLDRPFEELFDFTDSTLEPRPHLIITLSPGQTQTMELNGNMAQNRLIVAAAFREPYQSTWRASTVINPEGGAESFVSIDSTEVVIAPAPE